MRRPVGLCPLEHGRRVFGQQAHRSQYIDMMRREITMTSVTRRSGASDVGLARTLRPSALPCRTGCEPPWFDYCSVPAAEAKFLRGQAEQIRRRCVTSVVQIGRALIGAKHYLSPEAFQKWVKLEVGIAVRTAQDYMRVANWAADKGRVVDRLPPTVLYWLSSS